MAEGSKFRAVVDPHGEAKQLAAQRQRQVCILRFTNAQVLTNCPFVLAQIRATFRKQQPPPPSGSSRFGRTL